MECLISLSFHLEVLEELGEMYRLWFLGDSICIPLQSVSELGAYVEALAVSCLYFECLNALSFLLEGLEDLSKVWCFWFLGDGISVPNTE